MSRFSVPNSWFAILALVGSLQSVSLADVIDFNRDVRPILSDNCYACHGFDESTREADLRLDTREGAIADLGGYAAIVPGNPDASELIRRVTSTDAEAVMPPADSHKQPLDDKSIETLRAWIRQDAPWAKHWSLERPMKAKIRQQDSHPIDFFVQQKLKAAGFASSPRAAAHTLVRRLAFDLTGLPPSPEQIAAVGSNPTSETWNELIDQLLESPQFGERMAMWWLDGARYSDTDGFQQDAVRTNWPWRDWVVDAFNNNMPFDQFTIEQFAGDLLPNATPEQRLATCFHRNHMNNGEGGRDPQESRVDYVLDRVNTMGTLWLGLTLGCTQCHDHKFDPISQRDYYSLSAFFNSIDETGEAGSKAGPYMKYRSPYGQRTVDLAKSQLKQSEMLVASVVAEAEGEFEIWLKRQIERTQRGFKPWVPIRPARLSTTEGYQLHSKGGEIDGGEIIVAKPAELPQDDYLITAMPTGLDRITGLKLEVFPHPSHTDGKYSFSKTGEFLLTNIKLRLRWRGSLQQQEIPISAAVADVEGNVEGNAEGEDSKYGPISGTLDDDPRTGWTTRSKPAGVSHQAVFALAEPLVLADDQELEVVLMHRSLNPLELIGRFRLSVTDQRGPAVRSLAPMPLTELATLQAKNQAESLQPADLDPALRKRLLQQFLEGYGPWQRVHKEHEKIRRQFHSAEQAAKDLKVMVLADLKTPRKTHILQRGVWDQHAEEVFPNVLPMVLPGDAEKVSTRLELGRWIVSRDNPLTARVIANQIWQLLFGAGLVRTAGDFGMQGETPTHPQLLDWLAVEFMESGWDVKHLIRRIVASDTYRQDSAVDTNLLESDPENRLLAHGARFRLPSWMIRDAMLKTSGLLNPLVGGPPVFPYQPPGVWKDQFMGRLEYQPTIGPDRNRRTLYSFWRRTSAPTFLFDSAMRRTCEVVTRRTNTPIHALTLLNDVTSLEAARALADLALETEPTSPAARIDLICLRVQGRKPQPAEQTIYLAKHADAIRFFDQNREQAHTFTRVGQLAEPSTEQLPELAATMLLANMILNLDESMTHE
jgi:hypothetical protein